MRSVRPRRRRLSAGQLVIPALFALPTLVLFIYLIFETAKLSREKIRHQFAVDSAAFIEMTNYTDFLNRSAYVNGAFPHRIFEESFNCSDFSVARKDDTGDDCVYDILRDNGAFPWTTADGAALDASPRWRIQFTEPRYENSKTGRTGPQMNVPDPEEDLGTLELFTKKDAQYTWLSYDLAVAVYRLYAQVYQLLGSVEEAQRQVFVRLTQDHNFFRKSYWLNSGDCDNADSCGRQGAGAFNSVNPETDVRMHYLKKVGFWSNFPKPGSIPPYGIGPVPPVEFSGDGLFQLATVRRSMTDRLDAGIRVTQQWDAPGNYFNVNFNQVMGRPSVTCLIRGAGGRVWPDPTPKFQTRLYP